VCSKRERLGKPILWPVVLGQVQKSLRDAVNYLAERDGIRYSFPA